MILIHYEWSDVLGTMYVVVFVGVFGFIRVTHFFREQQRKKAAEALWRMTGKGDKPTGILIADLKKEIEAMKIDIDHPVSKKWRHP